MSRRVQCRFRCSVNVKCCRICACAILSRQQDKCQRSAVSPQATIDKHSSEVDSIRRPNKVIVKQNAIVTVKRFNVKLRHADSSRPITDQEAGLVQDLGWRLQRTTWRYSSGTHRRQRTDQVDQAPQQEALPAQVALVLVAAGRMPVAGTVSRDHHIVVSNRHEDHPVSHAAKCQSEHTT